MIKWVQRVIDPYIALMVLVVILAAIFPAQGHGAVAADVSAKAAIIFLFFLYGARMSARTAWDGLRQWRLQLAVLGSTFVLFPLLGLGLSALAPSGWPQALTVGLIFLCLLPSTVQSSIAFTSIARGNVPAAICAASASNIVGVFLTPVLAGLLLQTAGVQLGFEAFRDIILQLLAPFAAGQLLRPWIGDWVARNKQVLGYADRGSILLIIYVAFSKGMNADIWNRVAPLHLALLCVVLLALLVVVLYATRLLARHVFRFNRADEIVLQFCGSHKSLASGLPMASVIFAGPQMGLIILPLMLFHQFQLIACAILARRYGREADADTAIAEEPAKAGVR